VLQIKVGVELASLRLPFQKGLLMARELGASAVEIDARTELRPAELSQTGVRQVRKMLDDLNLRVSAVRYRTRRGYDVADQLEARIEGTKRAMSLAYDLGTNAVVNSLGRVPQAADAAANSTLLEALTDLGRHGQRVGAFLAAETGTESGADLAALLARLPPGTVGIDFNPANLVINGHSPRDAIRELGGDVIHMHATDATRDLALGRGVEVPLGQGNGEFPELLAALEEHQYRGYITVSRHNSDHPLEDIRQALEFLNNL
jgi:sugar phosphate isomerase/epimerase